MIVESPPDVMLAEQYLRMRNIEMRDPWVPIAGTAGAGTWKHSWSKLLLERKVAGAYIWLDNDLAGDPNPKMHKKLLAMWKARHPGAKTEPKPNAPKIETSLRGFGLQVDRYPWPDDAPAKADWGWIIQQEGTT